MNNTCGPSNQCYNNGDCISSSCKCIGKWDPKTFCKVPYSTYYDGLDIGLYMVTVIGCFILSILLTFEITYDIKMIKKKSLNKIFTVKSAISGKIFLLLFILLRLYVYLSYTIQSLNSSPQHPLTTEIASSIASIANTLALTLTSVNILAIITKAKKIDSTPKCMIYYKRYIYILSLIFSIIYIPLYIMIAIDKYRMITSLSTVLLGTIFLLSLSIGMTYNGIKAQKWLNKNKNASLAKKLHRKIYWIYIADIIVFLFLTTFILGFVWTTHFAEMIILSLFGFYTVFMGIAFYMLLENHLYNKQGKFILYGLYSRIDTNSSSKETHNISSTKK